MFQLTLVQPPRPKSTGSAAEEHWELTRPFSLFYLSAALGRRPEYSVRIVDMETRRYKDLPANEIFGDDPSEIFGITATTYTRFEAIDLAKAIKDLHPDALIVAGGVHFGYCAEDTLQHVPEIDVVVRGEGEITIVDLADAISNGRSLESIQGISYRLNGRMISNPDQCMIDDLDSLPVYDQYSWEDYPESVFAYPEKLRAASVMSSRGCPYSCIFCSKRGVTYRLRDANSVCDEIETLKQRYGVEGVNFLDLTLTATPRHARGLCEALRSRDLGLRWWCESRVNLPLELLEEMKSAGCVSIAVGVESGSQEMLSRLKKNVTLDQVRSFCKKCHDLGIYVTAMFIYSLPGEEERDVQETLDFIMELEESEFVSCAIQPAMIYPGTELERMALENGILPKDFSWSSPYQTSLNAELGQLPNCPIYVNELSSDFLKAVPHLLKEKKQRSARDRYMPGGVYDLSFREACVKWFRLIVIRREPWPKFLGWKFLKEYLFRKLHGKRASVP